MLDKYEIWTLLSHKEIRGIRVCGCSKSQGTSLCVNSQGIEGNRTKRQKGLQSAID